MKLVNKLIIATCIVSFLASCTPQEDLTSDMVDIEVRDTADTGDEGDDIGTPDDGIKNDSIIINTNATGDEGDDIGTPNN